MSSTLESCRLAAGQSKSSNSIALVSYGAMIMSSSYGGTCLSFERPLYHCLCVLRGTMTLSLLGPIGLPILVCLELTTISGFIRLALALALSDVSS